MGHTVIHAQSHCSKKGQQYDTNTEETRTVCPPPHYYFLPLLPLPPLSVLVIFIPFAARRPRHLSTRLNAVIQSAVTGRVLPDARLEMSWAERTGGGVGGGYWRVSDSIEMHRGSSASLWLGCETQPPRRSGTEAPTPHLAHPLAPHRRTDVLINVEPM